MAHTAQIVVTGNVGTAPRQWNQQGNPTACSFRVGSTRRYFSTKDNEWKSSETTWVGVKAFRHLADNVLKSISVGDPVIVVGNLSVDSWEKDGVQHTMPVVEATSIGHNLGAGTDVFVKDEPVQKPDSLSATPPAPQNGDEFGNVENQAMPQSAEQTVAQSVEVA